MFRIKVLREKYFCDRIQKVRRFHYGIAGKVSAIPMESYIGLRKEHFGRKQKVPNRKL